MNTIFGHFNLFSFFLDLDDNVDTEMISCDIELYGCTTSKMQCVRCRILQGGLHPAKEGVDQLNSVFIKTENTKNRHAYTLSRNVSDALISNAHIRNDQIVKIVLFFESQFSVQMLLNALLPFLNRLIFIDHFNLLETLVTSFRRVSSEQCKTESV